MDRDTIQGIAVKFETTPSEIARINKKPTLTFSIFPGDVSYYYKNIVSTCSIVCTQFSILQSCTECSVYFCIVVSVSYDLCIADDSYTQPPDLCD